MDMTETQRLISDCRQLDEMLNRREGEQDDLILNGIMAAVKQLCRSYDWFQTEMDAHRQAYENAKSRSVELETQLTNMLRLVEGYSGPIATPGTEETSPEPEPSPIPCIGRPTLVFYCFGAFRVFQDDQLVGNWNGQKGQLILKYLIAHSSKPVSKEKLMDALWPEADPESARRNLHQAVYSLRHTLKIHNQNLQYILFQNECYLLNPEVEIWIDFNEFELHIRSAHQLEIQGSIAAAINKYAMAEELYQGGFLEDEPYAEWAAPKRHQLQHLYLEIADKLSHYYFEQQQYTAAVSQCQRILLVDNCYEPAHRLLIECYLSQGQRHMAVRQYQACVQALKETLGLSPSEKTRLVYRKLIYP